MNAALDIALPTPVIPKPKTGIMGFGVPAAKPIRDVRTMPPEGIPLPYPAIEDLPEYFGRFDASDLAPACRSFNGSICLHDGKRYLAYRSEDYRGINRIVIARLNGDFGVIGNSMVNLPCEAKGQHWEDPHLASVGGRLHLMANSVRFGIPPVCQQRLFVLDQETLQPVREIGPLAFGSNTRSGGIEKNWLPFELPGGMLGIVYSQRPRVVIEVATARGHSSPGVVGWKHGQRINGRTPPLRVSADFFLEFFGGWVKHPWRNGRYFIGAHLFDSRPPFAISAATREPLAWGTEASPTIFSSRPGSNHPAALLPAGMILEGRRVVVSCGVNDSYIALLSYDLPKLMAGMTAVNAQGEFEP